MSLLKNALEEGQQVVGSLPRATSVDWEAVEQKFKELRGFGITQADFANRIGVIQSYLSAVEHG